MQVLEPLLLVSLMELQQWPSGWTTFSAKDTRLVSLAVGRTLLGLTTVSTVKMQVYPVNQVTGTQVEN